MEKKTFFVLLTLIALLVLCIALMSVSLLIQERTFGQVSGYLAIASVVITLVGVLIIMRATKHHKDE